MKKLKIYRTIVMLTMIVGIALMVASCGPTYVRGDYGRRPYYNYPPRSYRYAPQVVIVPRYCPPPRRGYYGKGHGNGNGNGRGRGRRW